MLFLKTIILGYHTYYFFVKVKVELHILLLDRSLCLTNHSPDITESFSYLHVHSPVILSKRKPKTELYYPHGEKNWSYLNA